MSDKGLKRFKYLDDLGIKQKDYFTNFCDNSDERYPRWLKQQEEYGFDDRETWNLDRMFIEWVYTRFMMYKEIGGKAVDLSFHKFNFVNDKGEEKEVTQEEGIDIILEACKKVLLEDDFLEGNRLPDNIMNLFRDILPAMWW